MADDIDDDFEALVADIGRRVPEDKEERDGMFAEGRLTNRTYASRSF